MYLLRLFNDFLLLFFKPKSGIEKILHEKPSLRTIIYVLFFIGLLRGVVETIWLYLMKGQFQQFISSLGSLDWYLINSGPFVMANITSVYFFIPDKALKAIDGLGKGTDYFRALLAPKQVSINQQRSVIVPALLYDIGTVLSVNMKTKLFYIKLNRLVLSSGNVSMFEFDVLDNAPVDLSKPIL